MMMMMMTMRIMVTHMRIGVQGGEDFYDEDDHNHDDDDYIFAQKIYNLLL